VTSAPPPHPASVFNVGMFVAPIVVSLSRLVGDRGKSQETGETGESGGGDESKAADHEEDTKVLQETGIRYTA
jgi:hypothetical protein